MAKRNIALAGNPNCGKTSLFNELTGANQYVGNWPGVTVERVTGKLKEHEDITLVDLPGIYSLTPYSPEEVVTRKYLLEEKPDMVINVVDATNMERNLYLTTQIIETGIPVVIALNMIDLAGEIDTKAIADKLGCPVIKVSAVRGIGLKELAETMQKDVAPAKHLKYAEPVEKAIADILQRCHGTRFEAIKVLEGEDPFTAPLAHDERLQVEREMEDDAPSVIAAARYKAIEGIVHRKEDVRTVSDRIDSVLTHRVAGPAIFIAVMWFVYYISIGTVGTWGTDWANDVLFGEHIAGWVDGLTGGSPAALGDMLSICTVLAMALAFPVTLRRLHDVGLNGCWLYLAIAPYIMEHMCPHLPGVLHTGILYILYIANAFLLLACMSFPGQNHPNAYGDKPKAFHWNPFGLDGRAGRLEYIVWLVALSAIAFGISYTGGHACLECSEQTVSLIKDGIIGGVGSVMGFLPQMAVLFLLLALLEDCGYMARVAFMMDRIFRTLGLSGKTFIPLMIAMGCGVPAIMATRTIENEKDRRMSIMLTTFIPCSAKLPIIALFAALLGQDDIVATVAYFAGIASVIVGGIMLRKTHMFAGSYTPFVMELPAYHTPRGANINLRAMERCKAFVRKAGTVIFLACGFIWFTSNYNWRMDYLGGEENAMERSIIADAGSQIAPLFTPLGWGDWKPAVAAVTGLVAKEQVIGTIGVLYPATEPEEEESKEGEEEGGKTAILTEFNAFSALTTAAWGVLEHADLQLMPGDEQEEEEEDEDAEAAGIATRVAAAGVFGTTGAALSFMLFNLLCAPCFAACGAIRREMNSARWTFFAIGYMCAWAYAVAFLVYQLDALLIRGHFSTSSLVAFGVILAILYQVFRPMPKRTNP